MNIAVAIGGLAFLILIHEAGHFFTALAVKMRPRRFYIFFPPALAKWHRNGIEYGIGAIPLGGYVKIPGMHKPAAGDLEAHLEPGARRRRRWPRRRRRWSRRSSRSASRTRGPSCPRCGRGSRHRPLGGRAGPPTAASPTSTTRSRPRPTGARRPGSASRSSSRGRRRTTSSPSSRSPSSSCSACRRARPASWRR